MGQASVLGIFLQLSERPQPAGLGLYIEGNPSLEFPHATQLQRSRQAFPCNFGYLPKLCNRSTLHLLPVPQKKSKNIENVLTFHFCYPSLHL